LRTLHLPAGVYIYNNVNVARRENPFHFSSGGAARAMCAVWFHAHLDKTSTVQISLEEGISVVSWQGLFPQFDLRLTD
jgi:hypothetical protein